MQDYLQKTLADARKRRDREKTAEERREQKYDELVQILEMYHGFREYNSERMIVIRKHQNNWVRVLLGTFDGEDETLVLNLEVGPEIITVCNYLSRIGLPRLTGYDEMESIMELVSSVLVDFIDPDCSIYEARLRGAVLDKVPDADKILSDYLKGIDK